jgi:hypothetical protein
MSSLLPERPLTFSPTLASTIGLEEAIMLQKLADLIEHRPAQQMSLRAELKWVELSEQDLQDSFPFWAPVDIRRIRSSLHSMGVILMEPKAGNRQQNFFAIDEVASSPAQSPPQPGVVQTPAQSPAHTPQKSPPASAQSGTAALIPSSWQPDENWVRLCKQHSIPEQFIQNLVPEFVNYWRERGQARFSWGNAFYKHVLREWRNEQTRKGAFELASTMSAAWRPSQDALEILVNSGISGSFIEDAIPEFVLYWRERGVVHAAWNTKFIEHIRKQWAKYSASFGRDDTPKPIPSNWQPSADCYEILQLAEIDEDYARNRVPEFVLYWSDSQQVKASWNTVFLQFIKQDWARKLKQLETTGNFHAEDQTITGSSQQRINEKFQRIADRSWAE